MKCKFSDARSGITALLVVLVSLCLALGVWLSAPHTVYADGALTGVEVTDAQNVRATEKVENSWEEQPFIVNWAYRGFQRDINKITAKPLQPKNANYEYNFGVRYSVLKSDGTQISNALTEFNVSSDGTVSNTNTVTALNNLEASKAGEYYILRAVVSEASGYTGLKEDVRFRVIQARNYWRESPAAISWRYGEFNSANIIAKPAFGNAQVDITDKKPDGAYIKSIISFTFDENGKIPEDALEKFSKLDSGSYYMVAHVSGSDNYTSLNQNVDDIAENGVPFSVYKVTNSWSSTPNVVQWNWGNYDKNVNLITAVPTYLYDSVTVTFGIFTDAACLSSDAWSEATESFTTYGGVVDSVVENSLKKLPAGTYYLRASVKGFTNYTEIKTVVQFRVLPAKNSWKITPNVSQWTWGGYDREFNKINAEPTFYADSNTAVTEVEYGIYADEKCNVKLSDNFRYKSQRVNGVNVYTLDESVYELLGILNAGTYYLKAEVKADVKGNYTALSSVVPFKVQGIQNNWDVTPSVLAWQYGEYSRHINLIQAVPSYGSAAEISIYDADGDKLQFDNGEDVSTSFLLQYVGGVHLVPEYVGTALKVLNVGKYYMLASVPADENGNYGGLNNFTSFADIKNHGIEFEVTSVANRWVEVPKIRSWSEGNYDSEVNKIIAQAANGNDRMVIYLIDAQNRIITSNAGGNQFDYGKLKSLPVGSYTLRFEISRSANYSELDGETTFAVFEDSVGLGGIIASVIVFAILDVFAAGACIIMLLLRRKKIEDAYRTMIRKELHRR